MSRRIRPPSPAALELVDRLVDRARFVPRDLPEEDARKALVALEQRRELGTLPYLFPLLRPAPPRRGFPFRTARVTPSAGVATAAAGVAGRLAMAANPLALIALDRLLRSSWRWEEGFPRLDDELLSRLEEPAALGLLGLASSQRDGFEREKALRRVAVRSGGAELRFILLRLDDWVPQVRTLAIAAASARMVPAYATTWIECLPLLTAFSLRGRVRESSFVSWVYGWMAGPERVATLHAGIAHPDRKVRLEAFRLCAERAQTPVRELVDRAWRKDDATLRSRALRLAMERLQGADLSRIARLAVVDSNARIAVHGLDLLFKLDPGAAKEELERALLHATETVRWAARYYLGKLGVSGFAETYRDALRSERPRTVVAALAGLEQTGDAQDLERVLPFLEHENGSVARAALRALWKLDRAGARRRALRMLLDRRPGVASAAARLLATQVLESDVDALWRGVTTAPHPQGRLRALALLCRLPWWTALPHALEALPLGEELRAASGRWIVAWLDSYGRGVYAPPRPPPEAWTRCAQALREARGLEPALAERIEAALSESRPGVKGS